MIVCTEYNFGAREVYERMGTVPLYTADLAAPTWPEEAGKWVRFARERGLAITYAAQPMTKPAGDFRVRREAHEEALRRLAELLGEDVPLRCILLDDEVEAHTPEAEALREMEQIAWTAVIKRHFPQVPLIRWLWSASGLYDRRAGKGWQPGRYWSGGGHREVVNQVAYYPDDIGAMITVMQTLVQEVRATGLPGCLTISLGAGYDANQKFGILDYDPRLSQAWGLLLAGMPEIQYVWLYPSPGHEKYQAAMAPHVEAFLHG